MPRKTTAPTAPPPPLGAPRCDMHSDRELVELLTIDDETYKLCAPCSDDTRAKSGLPPRGTRPRISDKPLAQAWYEGLTDAQIDELQKRHERGERLNLREQAAATATTTAEVDAEWTLSRLMRRVDELTERARASLVRIAEANGQKLMHDAADLVDVMELLASLAEDAQAAAPMIPDRLVADQRSAARRLGTMAYNLNPVGKLEAEAGVRQ